ncbi:GQ67_01454T0 [Komagataella phaffii]|nr:GQ67_01454T0 [Komagataella phaffii]AOA66481.1 GQ68_01470T0 [Komagataella phaffii GS115]
MSNYKLKTKTNKKWVSLFSFSNTRVQLYDWYSKRWVDQILSTTVDHETTSLCDVCFDVDQITLISSRVPLYWLGHVLDVGRAISWNECSPAALSLEEPNLSHR